MVSGGTDENGSAMSPVMKALRQIAMSTGAAVVVIHHPKKSSKSGERAGNALRGFGGIEGAIDLSIRVDREDDSDEVQVFYIKSRNKKYAPFGARFYYKQLGETEDMQEAKFYGTGPVETPAQEKARELWERIRQVVSDTPDGANQTQIVEGCKDIAGRNTVLRAVNWRENNGFLAACIGPRNSRVYTLVEKTRQRQGVV